MKKTIFLLFFSCFLWVSGQESIGNYLSYDEVVTKFFDTYSVMDLSPTSQISFQKRPKGWFVVVIDYSAGKKVLKDECFWDREKRSIQNLSFEKTMFEGENLEQMSAYRAAYDRQHYSQIPYYGYPGWDWDVIQELKDKSNLSDTTLYALGRAYSSYASNLLNNNSGLADESKQFKLSKGKNCLSVEQLKEYRLYRHLAIQKFKKLSEINPRFETIVGPIWIKASNEHMTSFLDLRMHQNEKEALAELADNLYTPFYISLAKNYLNSCAPNAILFTNGDNDTYPLLYVQAKYGFRTDVLVVNMSLLQTERYINSLREPTIKAPALPLTLTMDDVADHKKEVIYILKDEENNLAIDVSDLVLQIKSGKLSKSTENGTIYYSPSNRFIFNVDNLKMDWYVNKSYFFLNHLVFLDIMSSSNLKRPLYFAISMDSEHFFGLNDYLQLEGLAYRLTPNKLNVNNDNIGYVNSSILYKNLLSGFDWTGIEKSSQKDYQMCSLLRSSFVQLSSVLISENKLDSAKKVLDKCLQVLPDERVKFDFYQMGLIAEDYYKIKQFEIGNMIFKKILFNIKNGGMYSSYTEENL